jgi:hypothetical protein
MIGPEDKFTTEERYSYLTWHDFLTDEPLKVQSLIETYKRELERKWEIHKTYVETMTDKKVDDSDKWIFFLYKLGVLDASRRNL